MIGPDGAGKTTTFQILAGVMEATSGVAEVFGRPARETRSQTGYLTQTFSLYPDLSVSENIRYIGDLRRVPPEEIAERGHRYLRMFDMDRFADRLAGRLSGGMKQKLSLVCALVPQPHVLLLDEPTTGVDPVSRREFWDVLAHLAADGLTILVATPYLDEAERCHRVAFMHLGELQQIGTPAELRSSLHAKRLELRTPNLSEAEHVLAAVSGPDKAIIDVQRFGDRLDLLAHDPSEARRALDETHGRRRHCPSTTCASTTRRSKTPSSPRFAAWGRRSTTPHFRATTTIRDLRGQVAIGAKNLTKQFGDFTAVNDVNLEVRYGEIYGLLGANGAGKTTTIKMLCGLLDPTGGTIQLAGATGAATCVARRCVSGSATCPRSSRSTTTSRFAKTWSFSPASTACPRTNAKRRGAGCSPFPASKASRSRSPAACPAAGSSASRSAPPSCTSRACCSSTSPPPASIPLARRAFWTHDQPPGRRGHGHPGDHPLPRGSRAVQSPRASWSPANSSPKAAPAASRAARPATCWKFVVDQPQRAADLLKEDTERWRVSLFGDRLHVITDDDAEAGTRTTTEQAATPMAIHVRDIREGRFSLEDVFISVVEKARQQGKFASEDD